MPVTDASFAPLPAKQHRFTIEVAGKVEDTRGQVFDQDTKPFEFAQSIGSVSFLAPALCRVPECCIHIDSKAAGMKNPDPQQRSLFFQARRQQSRCRCPVKQRFCYW